MNPQDIAHGIANWLLSNRDARHEIIDPVHSQRGTYSNGFAALTFGMLAQQTSCPQWSAALEQSLKLARRQPADSEFDQLALLLLGKACKTQVDVIPYAGSRLVSNNWVAMRALSHSLVAQKTGRPEDRERAGNLWSRVLSWQSESGLFVDSPGGLACPPTYHAKFCAMLALAQEFTDQDESGQMRQALLRGLDSLAGLVSPGGVLIPYGRSRHTLFGYAAAILALNWGARHADIKYAAPAHRLLKRLSAFQQGDGHIPCLLGPGEDRKANWDVYINNPDYNSYAAALLLLTGNLAAAQPENSEQGLKSWGPLVTFRHREWFVALSGQGASVPWGTPFFCDPRYYGMQPVWIERDGIPVWKEPVYQWGSRSSLVDPSTNPWIPYVDIHSTRYTSRVYPSPKIDVREGKFTMESEGPLLSYEPVPRWKRALQGLGGRTAEMYTTCSLPGAWVGRQLTWKPGALNSRTHWSGLPRGADCRAESESWKVHS